MRGNANSDSKIKYVILLCACLVCIATCICLALVYQMMLTRDDDDALEALRDSIKQYETLDTTPSTAPQDTADTADSAPSIDPIEDTTADDAPEEGLLDFDTLWEVNPDIHAWIEIKDTKIDYPVLQSPDNDKKYLNTAYNGTWYIGGAIFTESTYNGIDFNDPVTVIYGHTMRSGTMFGQLQKSYSDPKLFEENSDIVIYLPDEVRHYKVFAAVPYSKAHILDTYDFSSGYWYKRFFNEVGRIREIGANFDREAFPSVGDRVIILSVCLNEDTARRYLVMAVFEEDLSDNVGLGSN